MQATTMQRLEINIQNQPNYSIGKKPKGTREKQEELPQEKCVIAFPPDNGFRACVLF